MSKIKVSTLTGPVLDYWAGRSNDDSKEYLLSEDGRECLVRTGTITAERYSPSTDWSQGGSIIEREGISTENIWHVRGNRPTKLWVSERNSIDGQSGTSPLESAMRRFVASKFGEEVDE